MFWNIGSYMHANLQLSKLIFWILYFDENYIQKQQCLVDLIKIFNTKKFANLILTHWLINHLLISSFWNNNIGRQLDRPIVKVATMEPYGSISGSIFFQKLGFAVSLPWQWISQKLICVLEVFENGLTKGPRNRELVAMDHGGLSLASKMKFL